MGVPFFNALVDDESLIQNIVKFGLKRLRTSLDCMARGIFRCTDY